MTPLNANRAFIDDRKLMDYCLSESHPIGKHKAKVFKSALGFSIEHFQQLKNAILQSILKNEANFTESNQYGDLYVVDIEVENPPKKDMETLELLDVVVLTEALPHTNLRKGELGTIVEVLDKDVFLVEFADTKGVTYALPTLAAHQLMKVYFEPAGV
ncbi:hypothetical protein FHS57_001052 [Runella defluvii]|uniref:DUF6883 domain-containing protein n=1 Tax=Runella defluvii TaxID=370973 RepID=A0A7W6EP36_9BACT|nr:DUF4926 domain-containing protein [Runella defluvii]MBB3837058.1 hypothetical protein [Runella defluvii]